MAGSLFRSPLFLILIWLSACGPAEAATWYVKADGSGDVPTIQGAVNYSSDWDTILVAAGRYTGEGNKNIDVLERTLVIRSESGAHETIIDCQNDGRGFRFVSGEGPATRLENITIANGYIEMGDGGGIWCSGSSPTIRNCIFRNNNAEDNGGGLCCSNDASPAITGCEFIGNEARYGGGICCLSNSTPSIVECVMARNTAHGGGGVYLSDADASLSQCLVVNNEANLAGGVGIAGVTAPAAPRISRTTIAGNRANLFAGGLDCINSMPVLSTSHADRNSIYHNTAGQGGDNLRTNTPLEEAQHIFWGRVDDSTADSLSVADGMLLNAAVSVDWWPMSTRPRTVVRQLRSMSDTLYFPELKVALEMQSISIFGDTTVTVTAWPDSTPPQTPAGQPLRKWYDIIPGSALMAYTAHLTLDYLQSEFDSSDIGDEASLYCARFRENRWNAVPGSVDTEQNRVECATSQFSIWAIGGQGGPLTAADQGLSGEVRPHAFRLNPNYPNPFNAATQISFSLPRESPVTVEIFNVTGQRVRVLTRSRLPCGDHLLSWDGSDQAGRPVGSGLYLCRLQAGDLSAACKIVLLR
jgi:predicted outer membrane repeat protein